MRTTQTLLALLATASYAWADVAFSVPAAGGSIAGGTAFTVTWADSGTAPLITDLSTYTLFLFSGSNAVPAQLYQLAAASFTAGNSVSVTVPVTTGGTGTNAYFLGMLSVGTAGGTIWNYSSRFTLTGMTGTFSTAVTTALASVSGTSGPPTVNSVVVAGTATTAAAGATTAADVYDTPYYLQTGLTKYAPMQPVPPTSITKTDTAPLYPTSSVVFATTYLPTPSVVTTITQANTFSVSSHANTASAAALPTDDMAKFLRRWVD